jgi:dienelactone hydrolase
VKQGADILAHAQSDRKIQVFIPDLFNGNPASLEIFPPDNPEKKKKLNDFFSGPANPTATTEKIPGLFKSLNEEVPGIKKWALLGYCWGGKVLDFIKRSDG